MIIIIGAILGAIIGALIAKRRKGNTADILQYAAVYCLVFTLAALFLTIFIYRGAT